MTLATIAMVHNRPDNVAQWATSVTHHPDRSDEIFLIDQSSDLTMSFDNGIACRTNGITHFFNPKENMNMSQGLNVGIKLSQSDYVMMTGIDWLFSPNFFTILRSKTGEGKIVQCLGGYLPEGCDLHQDWSTLKSIAEQGEISRRLSPGCCQCVPRSWALKVHGYDERFPAQDGVDDDFRSRAIKDGLESTWIEWNEAQAIHMFHPKSPLKGIGSELFSGDNPVVANLRGWGEY
jgi:hypothetical protein